MQLPSLSIVVALMWMLGNAGLMSLNMSLMSLNRSLMIYLFGCHNFCFRARMADFFISICNHHKLPSAIKVFNRDVKLPHFLYTPVGI